MTHLHILDVFISYETICDMHAFAQYLTLKIYPLCCSEAVSLSFSVYYGVFII